MTAIYRLHNKVNGKNYVGQAKHPGRRLKGHLYAARRGDPKPLYASIRKHGEENFLFEILEECEPEQANDREQRWVSHFDSFNSEKGYNLTSGGRQCEFGPMSEEHKRKIGDANKISKKGVPLSEEAKQKLSDYWKGHPGYWLGRTHSEESNLKRSEKMKGRAKPPRSAEHRAKLSEAKRLWHAARKSFREQGLE